MDKDRINIIFYMLCDDKVITEEELRKKFTDSEINFLIEKDWIYEDKGIYYISYVEDLVDFIKETMNDKLYGVSKRAIDKAYELAPDNFEILTLKTKEEFLSAIRKKDYSKVIDLIYEMKDVANENEMKDVNTYIYLLNMIVDLDDDLRLSAKFFKLHDLTINSSDERYEDHITRNDIRRNIFYQKYSNALRSTKSIFDKSDNTMAYDGLISKITEEVATNKKKFSTLITELAKEDKEDEILILYEEEANKRKLTQHEEYVVKICKKLSDIRKSGIVPISKKLKEAKFYDMVDNNDFSNALKRAIEMNKGSKLPLDLSINYILLSKINEEIEKINNDKKVLVKDSNN